MTACIREAGADSSAGPLQLRALEVLVEQLLDHVELLLVQQPPEARGVYDHGVVRVVVQVRVDAVPDGSVAHTLHIKNGNILR